MKRAYIDASVLIDAFQGEENISNKALAVLDDPIEKETKPMFRVQGVKMWSLYSAAIG